MAWPSVYGLEASKFRSSGSVQPSRPTIVLIHDAFHVPEHFETLAAGLTASGFRVVVPRLPSSGTGGQANALEADIQSICRSAGPDLQGGRDLVMVMHGYSSIPGSIAAERLNEFSLQRPRAGQVVQLIFFAGIIASRGESLSSVFRADWMRAEGQELQVTHPVSIFYQDCTSAVARFAAARINQQAASSFATPVSSPGWQDVACLYVMLESDAAVSPAYQRHYVQKLRNRNRETTVRVMPGAGHSPFLSQARETLALIIAAANEASE